MRDNATVFANTLFSLSEEENCTKEVLENLFVLRDLTDENKSYVTLLDSPSVPLPERLSLIDEAFSSFHIYVLNFIKVLTEKKSMYLVGDCVRKFEKLYNKKHNIEKVKIITVKPLSDKLKDKLINKLSEGNKTIIPEYVIDESILGGIIIRSENTQMDASFKTRLADISEYLSTGNLD